MGPVTNRGRRGRSLLVDGRCIEVLWPSLALHRMVDVIWMRSASFRERCPGPLRGFPPVGIVLYTAFLLRNAVNIFRMRPTNKRERGQFALVRCLLMDRSCIAVLWPSPVLHHVVNVIQMRSASFRGRRSRPVRSSPRAGTMLYTTLLLCNAVNVFWMWSTNKRERG